MGAAALAQRLAIVCAPNHVHRGAALSVAVPAVSTTVGIAVLRVAAHVVAVHTGAVGRAIGAIVVITTSTLNRVLVVELALPAMIPGALVALHYFVQILRPRLGYSSDIGGRRTPWIIGGMGVLGLGAVMASLATAMMATQFWAGLALAVVAFLVIGGGVGACGTALLVLLSKSVAQTRLAAAATVTWVMMIVGFIVTTILAAKMLEPFSLTRLVEMTAVVAAAAFLVTVIATRAWHGAAAS